LVAAIFSRNTCFEKAGANGVQRIELVTISEQVVTPSYFASCGHHLIDTFHFALVQAEGHAELAQIAVGTGDFDTGGTHWNRRTFVLIQVNFLQLLNLYYGAQI
jgi:hypothetical protein